MIQWLKDNWGGLAGLLAAVILITGLAIAGGCSLDRIVKMDVPVKVSSVTGAPATIPLADAEYWREKYMDDVERDLRQYDQSYADASFIRELLAMGINIGFTVGSGALSGLPGGAALVGVLGALGGLFISKPGDKAARQKVKDELERAALDFADRLTKEKIDSFNAGTRRANTGVVTSG